MVYLLKIRYNIHNRILGIYVALVLERVFMEKKLGFGKQITFLLICVSILTIACSVVTAIINVRNALSKTAKKEISEVTEIAYNILNGYDKRVKSGELTLSQAQALALEDMRNFKYQGKNYVWVMDYNCIYLYHGVRKPGFDGKTLTNSKGQHYIQELGENAINNRDVYLKDYSVKPGDPTKKKYPKYMSGRAFPAWHWIVATGIYIDEIDYQVSYTLWNIVIVNLIAIIVLLLLINQTFVRKMVFSLNKIIDSLMSTSEDVASSASVMETTSRQLAQGSSEQASAIQETSSTMEETSSMVKQNNENTKHATVLAKNTREYATESAKATQQMMQTMNELENSSQEISKVIKAIDEIAFQTNILSLNAAVEAARAGEVGKGFAVVAEEVRNLAQRSAQAAKDTSSIIENNINLSKQGFEMAKNVDDSLSKINGEVVKVDEILDEISVATNEQSVGIDQINKAISSIEQTLQDNAQTADKTSAASESLKSHASDMNDAVELLSNIVNGSDKNN